MRVEFLGIFLFQAKENLNWYGSFIGPAKLSSLSVDNHLRCVFVQMRRYTFACYFSFTNSFLRNKIDERGQNTVLFFSSKKFNVWPYLIHSHGSKDLKNARMDFQSSVRYDTNYDFLPSFRTPHLAFCSAAQMSNVLYNGVHSL